MKRYIKSNINVPDTEYKKLSSGAKYDIIKSIRAGEAVDIATMKQLATDSSRNVRARLAECAQYEKLPNEIIKILAQDSSPSVVFPLITYTDYSNNPEILIALSNCSNADVRKHLIKQYRNVLPEQALRNLATTSTTDVFYNVGKDVRAYVANNPRTPADVLKSIASTDTSITVAEALTQNKALTPEVMKYIITDGTPVMKRCLADAEYIYHILPDDLRTLLYKKGTAYVKRVLDGKDANMNSHKRTMNLKSGNISEDMINSILDEFSSDPKNVYPDLFSLLHNPNVSDNSRYDIILALIGSDLWGSSIDDWLRTMTTVPDEIFEDAMNFNSSKVYRSIAGSKYCPIHIIREIYDLLDPNDPDDWTLSRLANNPNTPEDIVLDIYNSGNLESPYLILGNPNIPSDLIRTLYKSLTEEPNPYKPYFWDIIENPNTPEDILLDIVDNWSHESTILNHLLESGDLPDEEYLKLVKLANTYGSLGYYHLAHNPNISNNDYILNCIINSDDSYALNSFMQQRHIPNQYRLSAAQHLLDLGEPAYKKQAISVINELS